MRETKTNVSYEMALDRLGLGGDADPEAVRAAYLKAVAAHPPDLDPDAFEQIRDAYDVLRDPLARANRILESPPIAAPLTNLFPVRPKQRQFAGPSHWLAALKEKP